MAICSKKFKAICSKKNGTNFVKANRVLDERRIKNRQMNHLLS